MGSGENKRKEMNSSAADDGPLGTEERWGGSCRVKWDEERLLEVE